MIFLGPFFVNKYKQAKKAAKGFEWVGIGGALIGIGGIALAFLTVGKPLLGIFTADLVFNILSAILFLMTVAFAWGFVKRYRELAKLVGLTVELSAQLHEVFDIRQRPLARFVIFCTKTQAGHA